MEKKLLPVYYFYGAEDYLIEDRALRIKSSAISGAFESMNLQVFDPKDLDIDTLVISAKTLPAFAPKRVVWVKNAQSLKAEHKQILTSYLENPSPYTCLIFTSSASKIDEGTGFLSLIKEKGEVRCFWPLKEGGLLDWIRDEVRSRNRTITHGAAMRLISVAGKRLRDLKTEIDKIVLFVGEKIGIDERDVEDAGIDLKEENVFEFAEAIGSKDIKKALKVYSKLSAVEPVMVLGAVSSMIRRMIRLKSLLKKAVPQTKICNLLGIYPSRLDGYIHSSSKFTEACLLGSIKRLATVDLMLKGARLGPELAMTGLIIELCGKD
ncbi:MAG: DNA polymerase III subunit delta [Deltaproteobacteria bacterium]|nr:DNA polymerase III subunit delta [Deltaproteobacteria bacterium]